MSKEYNPESCFRCRNDVWANRNYCELNKRLRTEKYYFQRHPKCPLLKGEIKK